jgi:hypothetical protein
MDPNNGAGPDWAICAFVWLLGGVSNLLRQISPEKIGRYWPTGRVVVRTPSPCADAARPDAPGRLRNKRCGRASGHFRPAGRQLLAKAGLAGADLGAVSRRQSPPGTARTAPLGCAPGWGCGRMLACSCECGSTRCPGTGRGRSPRPTQPTAPGRTVWPGSGVLGHRVVPRRGRGRPVPDDRPLAE